MAEIKMNHEDFPSNSNHSKENQKEKEKKEKIAQMKTNGSVVAKKKNILEKLSDLFIKEHTDDVKEYIFLDVLVPMVKNTLWDIITGTSEMLLFGEIRNKSRSGQSGKSSYISYSSYYNKSETKNRSDQSFKNAKSLDNLIFESRWEAEEVLSNLVDLIEEYGAVSIADLYEMIKITGAFTDNYWGWTNLSAASVKRIREGYLLVLPKAISLK